MKDELTCPRCGKRMRYDFQQSKIMCPDCKYSPLEAKMAEAQARGPRPEIDITHRGEVNHNALFAFRTGHDLLYKGDKEEALDSFRRALRFQPDFADAHFWIAELTEDEKIKREHFGIILAHDPSHPEALRKLMILNGRLTSEQAARTHHYNDLELKQTVEPIKTETQVLLCPVCSGNLTVDDESGRVECRFCGHVEQRAPAKRSGDGFDSLAMALIERKAKGTKWVIGERLLHCNECGAERTIPARKLSQDCPFCGSTHVIVQDALKSFEQPDGLVQFSISREEAKANIKAQLGSITQRIANLFDNNRVKSALLDGVYLPFWVFDAVTDITETRTCKGSNRDSRFAMTKSQTRSTYTDGVYNLAVCAVHSPPANITEKLGKYKFDAVIPYEAKLLAKYPAELYSIDFDKASLEARSKVSAMMRKKHGRKETGDEQVQISIFSAVRDMSFRLLLLPVWVASLTEEDGDIRTALVNGQTGKVVLGKAEKKKKR